MISHIQYFYLRSALTLLLFCLVLDILKMSFSTCDGFLSSVLCANFSQDFSSLSIGRSNGYSLYQLDTVESLNPIFSGEFKEACIVERFFSSSLIFVTSMKSPRVLNMINFRKKLLIRKTSYSNTILAVKMNRSVFVVLLEQSIHIHCSKSMSTVHIIHNTPHNPKGLFALSPNEALPWLAYPVSPESGEIQLFDFVQFRNGAVIHAHSNPIAAMCFNPTGTMLATASDKGTLIRVFDLTGTKLYEFRRGMRRCALIYSISFSPESDFLVVSSSTETVHVFKLDEESLITAENGSSTPSRETVTPSPPSTPEGHEASSWYGYFGNILTASTTYLPATVSEFWTQPRSFAFARLHFSNIKSVCTMVTVKRKPYLLVVAANGYMYIYSVNVKSGGECALIKQHELDRPEPFDSPRHQSKCVAANNVTTTYAQVVKSEVTEVEGADDCCSRTRNTSSSLSGDDLPSLNYDKCPSQPIPLDYSGQFPSIQ